MNRMLRALVWAGWGCSMAWGADFSLLAQVAEPPAVATAEPAAAGPFRKLAPGAMTVVPATIDPEDAVSYHDLPEILALDPTFAERPNRKSPPLAKNVRIRHDVWALEFQFKPVRFIRVPLPLGPNGALQETVVWYLLYAVRNTSEKPVLFVPRFTLESVDAKKSYVDTVLPAAIAAIRDREDPNRPLRSTVEIAGEIPMSTPDSDQSVWGVATWIGVDAATDAFSVYVEGLTNAYRWEEQPGAYQAGAKPGSGRKITSKTLQLNFWRPSDQFYQHEREIRLGTPDGGVDYRWVYR